MARFFGEIGYSTSVETEPSIWEELVEERHCTGSIIRSSRRRDDGQNVNGELVINNQISIVADQCVLENVYNIRYVKMYGTRWKVTNVEVQHPRLLITLGGVYKGETTS